MTSGLDPWEISIKDLQKNIDLSLKIDYKNSCPICLYPKKKEPECHVGLLKLMNKIDYTTGHLYSTDFTGKATNWFTSILQEISENPYKKSHEILKIILLHRIKQKKWNIEDIKFASMVPTNNHQMSDLFQELTHELQIPWINCNSIFITRFLNKHYDNREEYVKNKYDLNKNTHSLLQEFEGGGDVLIFDDVFHTGYTFGRIVEILDSTINIENFKLISIARTTPKSILKYRFFP